MSDDLNSITNLTRRFQSIWDRFAALKEAGKLDEGVPELIPNGWKRDEFGWLRMPNHCSEHCGCDAMLEVYDEHLDAALWRVQRLVAWDAQRCPSAYGPDADGDGAFPWASMSPVGWLVEAEGILDDWEAA